MSFLARFPGTSLDDDRRESRETLQDRMAAAHTCITATVSDICEAAWDGITSEAWPGLTEADCDAAEARAEALTAALLVLRDGPPPVVTDAQRRAVAELLTFRANIADKLAASPDNADAPMVLTAYRDASADARAAAALLLHGLEARA